MTRLVAHQRRDPLHPARRGSCWRWAWPSRAGPWHLQRLPLSSRRATGFPAMATPTSFPSCSTLMANLPPTVGLLWRWCLLTNRWLA